MDEQKHLTPDQYAQELWEVYAAMCRSERESPRLRDNQFFQAHKAEAFANFNIAFEALQ